VTSEIEQGPGLRQTTLRAALWSYGAVGVGFALQLAYTAVMSRRLDPADFGVVATAIVATQLIGLLARMGIGSAITQRGEISESELRSAHGYSIAVGAIALAATATLAIPMSWLLRLPESAGAISSMGFVFLAVAVGAVPEAKLRREFRFRELAAALTATTLVADVVGVWIATATDLGFWALVVANVLQPVLYSAAAISRSRLGAPVFRTREAHHVASFGRRLTTISVLEYIGKTADNLAVSRWLGAAQAGFYSRAQLLTSLVPENLMSATARFFQPILSRVKDDPLRFSRSYADSFSILSLTVLAPVALVSAGAGSIVPILLGPGWDESVPMVSWLSVGWALGALNNLHGLAAEARGALQLKLRVQLIASAMAVLATATVVFVGPTMPRFAAGWAASEVARSILYMAVVLPRLGIRPAEILRRAAEASGVAVVAAAPVFLTTHTWGIDSLGALLAAGMAGCTLAGALVALPIPTRLSIVLRSMFERRTSGAPRRAR